MPLPRVPLAALAPLDENPAYPPTPLVRILRRPSRWIAGCEDGGPTRRPAFRASTPGACDPRSPGQGIRSFPGGGSWQSEFLQLVWQAAGLAMFYYWGSSQSRDSDERIEAKLDALLRERNIDPENPATRAS